MTNPLADGIARVLTNLRRPPEASTLQLEQALALDPRRRLLVVRCGARRLLLLTGGPQDLSLGWLPPDEATALSDLAVR